MFRNIPRPLFRHVKNLTIRHFCNVLQEELLVQTFCDIQVKVPYNVRIKPLDVHKYHNCDLLKIELEGLQGARKTIKHIQDGNNIQIFATTDEYCDDTTCNIHAPVKANLNVEAQGNIRVGVFGGSKLFLTSTKGGIVVDKYQGDVISLKTENGDIIMKGAVVASNITAEIGKNGSIKAKRLQGNKATLKTAEGNISVDCSYCDDTIFDSGCGDLDLQNIHKRNKIFLKNGKLNISGLDGQLEATLSNTKAEIQIARILDDSKITVLEGGELKLLLSDECQGNTLFEILTKKHTLDPSVRLIPSVNAETLYLMPTADSFKKVRVECEGGPVHIQTASWVNMLKLNVKK